MVHDWLRSLEVKECSFYLQPRILSCWDQVTALIIGICLATFQIKDMLETFKIVKGTGKIMGKMTMVILSHNSLLIE